MTTTPQTRLDEIEARLTNQKPYYHDVGIALMWEDDIKTLLNIARAAEELMRPYDARDVLSDEADALRAALEATHDR